MTGLSWVKNRLAEGEFTCVLKKGEKVYESKKRGVKPLVELLELGEDFTDCYAADRVVGKATAFLYVLIGARRVYARVISKSALEVFSERGITVEYETLADYIVNRKGDGRCPFEELVLNESDEKTAYQKIKTKLSKLVVEGK